MNQEELSPSVSLPEQAICPETLSPSPFSSTTLSHRMGGGGLMGQPSRLKPDLMMGISIERGFCRGV